MAFDIQRTSRIIRFCKKVRKQRFTGRSTGWEPCEKRELLPAFETFYMSKNEFAECDYCYVNRYSRLQLVLHMQRFQQVSDLCLPCI